MSRRSGTWWESQKVRFIVAGSLNTALDFLILNALSLLVGLPTLVANLISVTVGISVSYLLNHFFVFRHPERPTLRTFATFFLVTGFSSLVLQSLIIYGFERFFDTRFGTSLLFLPSAGEKAFLAINAAKLVAVLVGLVWNFCLYKFVVFRQPAGTSDIAPDLGGIVDEIEPAAR
ncbi:Putative flippase GtrA (transmembrane translocase of bactoprenol-linked glucose) [Rathayibacter oskolensis]|uniref:Putative flippase GtrA (Transmembrane translocase of bactoprenol-linked glucose) n=1 Tax=Rathayibacter oskolensis TaxID=1891671 RepID=A0A1X7N8D7_9MICO|nr:GtrA family protein [Rathayibacter oskolensis]SMH33276.1 Putative flippase GtrA (transmembrane translocase of bactoprenol-linked glucose) [Rathayibacter oskolensis]